MRLFAIKFTARLGLLLLGLLLLSAGNAPARAEDSGLHDAMFAPAPAAASAINFDGRGFLIHGKRTFIASGGMEYARIPRALWRDRLLRLKRDGFNCVEIYTFWNYHELRPGQFDFAGDKDLDAFLKLAKSLDLYVIARVGPYYCAEWDSGGYPVWLRFVQGMGVREDNPAFLAAVDRFWGRLMPIVAANQINRGGSVILVQLENEHLRGAGREVPNTYFAHLRDKALALGLEVPYFFSGLHHGGDPAGDRPWSSRGQLSPWITTEFWSVNFDRYGQTLADADTFERRMWKVLAYGGAGLNFYMLHGGTNFGYTNNDEDAASYDYGSAIGQAGDLRPTYYRFKRAALFARSFESILEDSDNATEAYKGVATAASVRVTARAAAAGTILFLDNPGKEAVKTQIREKDGSLFPTSTSLTLAPGQIAPIVGNFPVVPGVTLERSTPLLGFLKQGAITTLVAVGTVGDTAEMRFQSATPAANVSAGIAQSDGNRLTARTLITPNSTDYASFQVGSQTIRIIALSANLADHTWFADNNVLIGPDYIGDMTITGGKVHLTAESKVESQDGIYALGYLYGSDGVAPRLLFPARMPGIFPAAPILSKWQTLPGNAEAAPLYADAAWKASPNPKQMGADGDSSAYAWYRAKVTVPQAGNYTLAFADGGDWASVFVNGRHAAAAPVSKGVAITLPAGTSSLAVLTAHYGRPKRFGYMGPLDVIDVKGLQGPVVLDKGVGDGTAITTWRLQADAGTDHAVPPTNTDGAGWTEGRTGAEIFHGRRGFAWYVTTLPQLAGAHHRLHFENVDDNATVFLNGRQVATHNGWGQAFDAPLDAAWHVNGTNTLAVLVENTDNGGGIQGAVTLKTIKAGDEIAVMGWKMRGGIAEPETLRGWKAGNEASSDGSPAFHRATFEAAPPGKTGPHPILRVTTTGLSRGFVWLNGHNLGRYPEKIPIDGLYLPECWLKSGRNELVIFDEEGHQPKQVKLWIEQAASRIVVSMMEK